MNSDVNNQRDFKREFFSTQVEINFSDMPTLYGNSLNVSGGGLLFKPDANCTIDTIALKPKTKGSCLLCIYSERENNTIEFPCEIIRAQPSELALHFVSDQDIDQDDIKQTHTLPDDVFVRRSDGSLERGWRILPYDITLPDPLTDYFAKKTKKNLCVICGKKIKGSTSFKVYPFSKLHSIQIEAEEMGLQPTGKEQQTSTEPEAMSLGKRIVSFFSKKK